MDFKKHPNGGLYYRFDKSSYLGDIRGFRKAIKKLKSWAWPCYEFDDAENWGFVGKQDLDAFWALKELYIDRPKNEAKQLKALGFKPLKSDNKFRRRAIVKKPPTV